MITDEDFNKLCKRIQSDYGGTGFVLIMFDPTDPDGEALHSTNVTPKAVVLDTVRQYLKINSPSPNRK